MTPSTSTATVAAVEQQHQHHSLRFDDRNLQSVAQLDPKLIHDVLLTHPSKFHQLSSSSFSSSRKNDQKKRKINLTFKDFLDEHLTKQHEPTKTAYRDHVVWQVYERRQMLPLQQLIFQDLHPSMRALVPNRPDLHRSVLSSQQDLSSSNPSQTIPILLETASILANFLESPARSETTQGWIQQAQRWHDHNLHDTIQFVVNSIFFLLHKVELCQEDTQDFYLQTVWAPRIHREGPQVLRDAFRAKFGGEGPQSYPITKRWIQSLMTTTPTQNLDNNNKGDDGDGDDDDSFHAMIRQGWVNTILFHKDTALELPEVLYLDLDAIRRIRRTCQRAIAACALALHAGTRNPPDDDPADPIALRLTDLMAAIRNEGAANTQAGYEQRVADCVVGLAIAVNDGDGDNSHTEKEESLRSLTEKVLRGQDPVLQLLDRRMQSVFAKLIVGDHRLAATMRSGRGSAPSSFSSSDRFREAFNEKGMVWYASELSDVCQLALRVIDQCIVTHADVLQQCRKKQEHL